MSLFSTELAFKIPQGLRVSCLYGLQAKKPNAGLQCDLSKKKTCPCAEFGPAFASYALCSASL